MGILSRGVARGMLLSPLSLRECMHIQRADKQTAAKWHGGHRWVGALALIFALLGCGGGGGDGTAGPVLQLRWQAAADADGGYAVFLNQPSGFRRIDVSAGETTLSLPLNETGRFSACVSSVNASGVLGVCSPVVSRDVE